MSGTGQQTIVVIGLSGAGLKTFNLLLEQLNHAKNYQSNIRIIAIEKSHYPYWAPGSLRASVLNGFEHKVVRNFDHLIPTNIQRHHPDQVNIFTGTEVRELDLKNRLLTLDKPLDLDGLQIIDETGNKLKFDYLVIASGSSYPFPCRPPPEAETSEELKTQLRTLQEQIKDSTSIVVVGAGVVGIELAGEISSQYKHKSITLICSTDTLLPDQNPTLSDSLKNQLAQRNVKIIYGSKANIAQLGITKTGKLDKRSKIGLTRSDGGESSEEVEADFVFLAIGNKPNTQFVPAEYLCPKSRLIKVNEHLQVVGEDGEPVAGVYGVGDATNFQEAKLYAALDGQAATASKNLWIDVSDSHANKVIHKPIKGTISVPLGPCGGATELFGFTFGLGPWSTSLIKGRSLFVWMFNSMYPE